MQYAIPDALEGAWNGKPKCARGVKQNSSGVKHFLEGVKKNLGGFNPPYPPPPENLPTSELTDEKALQSVNLCGVSRKLNW